jgi:hypothetical protein
MTYYFSKNLLWVRFYFGGFSIKRTPPLFSERNKYRKTYPLIFGWRFKLLKGDNYEM